MNRGDLTTGSAQIRESLQNLEIRWVDSKQSWRDQVAAEFERRFIEPIEPKTRAALNGIERLGQVFTQARQECGET